MTIADLKRLIEPLSDDLTVILQKDPEGNGYNYMTGLDPDCMVVDDDWELEITPNKKKLYEDWVGEELTDEEWEELRVQYPDVVVIYP